MAKKKSIANRSARTKNKKMRIGFKCKDTPPTPFVADGVTLNLFKVFGDRIGTANPNNKTVHLLSNGYVWQDPPDRVQNAGRDALEIRAWCRPVRAKRKPKRGKRTTDDDLNVTIILDESTPNEDKTSSTFDDVQYDP